GAQRGGESSSQSFHGMKYERIRATISQLRSGSICSDAFARIPVGHCQAVRATPAISDLRSANPCRIHSKPSKQNRNPKVAEQLPGGVRGSEGYELFPPADPAC